jgi:hypothetical protein
MAGLAVKTLSNVLLGHEEGTEGDLGKALSGATPEQLANIKQIDADFKTRMKELDIDLERISAGDRDSARKMQMETKDWVPKVLALAITIGFFGILVWMLVNGMPPSGTEALLMMLGALGTAWTGVVNFYYGSSAGSKAKTDALASKEAGK